MPAPLRWRRRGRPQAGRSWKAPSERRRSYETQVSVTLYRVSQRKKLDSSNGRMCTSWKVGSCQWEVGKVEEKWKEKWMVGRREDIEWEK